MDECKTDVEGFKNELNRSFVLWKRAGGQPDNETLERLYHDQIKRYEVMQPIITPANCSDPRLEYVPGTTLDAYIDGLVRDEFIDNNEESFQTNSVTKGCALLHCHFSDLTELGIKEQRKGNKGDRDKKQGIAKGNRRKGGADGKANVGAFANLMCRSFEANKTCRFGDVCKFQHGEKTFAKRWQMKHRRKLTLESNWPLGCKQNSKIRN